MEAVEDIEAGQPIFDTYGKKCNSRFFLNYGFIDKDNDEFNQAPLIVKSGQSQSSEVPPFKGFYIKADIDD